jgi:ribosomal protein S18 acetylase RimI-like enzyme
MQEAKMLANRHYKSLEPGASFIFKYKGQVIGEVDIRKDFIYDGWSLWALGIYPEFQGRHLVDILLHDVEKWLIRHDADSVSLNVSRSNKRAIRAYERNGFECIGQDHNEIHGSEKIWGCSGLHMRKVLHA